MIITERDMKILKFIDRFQFSKRRFIKEIYFSTNTPLGAEKASYDRLTKLCQEGFLKKTRDLRNREHIYLLNSKAIDFLAGYGENPSSQSNLAWSKFVHNEMIQRVLIEFTKLGQRRFLSERDFVKYAKRTNLIPDLVLVTDEDKLIYIEIELEEKNYAELTTRAESFALEKNLKSVLYVCGNKRVENKVQEAFRRATNKVNLYCIEESHFFNNAKTFCQEVLA